MLTRRQAIAILLTGMVAGTMLPGAIIAFAGFLDPSYTATSGVTYNASGGPGITLTESADIESGNPFESNSKLVLNTSNGNVTAIANGDASANISGYDTGDEWTNLSNLDVTTELYINPDANDPINVSGDPDYVNYTDAEVGDGNPDFKYGGTTGTTTVTVHDVPKHTYIAAIDTDTTDVLASANSSDSTTVTLSGMPNSDHTVELETGDGQPSISDQYPEGRLDYRPTELNVTINDSDFPNENVSVEFFLDGSSVGTDHVTTDGGEASTTITLPSREEHKVRVNATDSYGQTTETSYNFSVPNNLTVREQTDPYSIIDDQNVNFTFFYDGQIEERNTTNGNVTLDDLPTDGNIVVEVESKNTSTGGTVYKTSFVTIRDITKQTDIYLLEDSEPTYTIQFVLEDRTGGLFANNNASLDIQKPINQTTWEDPRWQTIYSDEFGADGIRPAELEQDQRHRLILYNDQGDKRVLGNYNATESETKVLKISAVDADLEEQEGDFGWNASYVNTSDTRYVSFGYNDTRNQTSQITVRFVERGNESNILVKNQTFGGPLGSFKFTHDVPDDEADTDWNAEVWIERNDETMKIVRPVGPQNPVLGDMSPWLKAMLSVGLILIVAGLFSQLNGAVGGLVVAGMGGMFWFVDFLPQTVGYGVILLSMIVAAVIFINEQRGQAFG